MVSNHIIHKDSSLFYIKHTNIKS